MNQGSSPGRNIDHLNNELLDLKSCQIDIINLSIKLFSYVSIFIVAVFGFAFDLFYKNKEPLHEFPAQFNELHFIFFMGLIFILSITPIAYPLFMRIILHKCRSIFRILGYIRVVEEFSLNKKPILPYEIAYAKLRCLNIFSERIIQDEGTLYYLHYKPLDIIKEIVFSIKKVPLYNKIDYKKLANIYTGRYYKNKWFFLKILACLHLILITLLVSWLVNIKTLNSTYIFLFILYFLILLIWCIYNERLIHRYFFEIHYYPFSIHSWYCMFKLICQNPDLCASQFEHKYIECLTNRCT